jgi:glycosyltransferase involved in cell wall biosynthesis
MKNRDMTVVIPALNEENTIASVLDATLKVTDEIIVVDDGSSDRTSLIVGEYRDRHRGVRLLRHHTRKGKGCALRNALEHVRTDLVGLQDADLEYPPENLVLLTEQGDYKMIIGQRTMVMTDLYRQVSLTSFAANKMFAHLAGVPDVFSGQRVLQTDFMRSLNLRSDGFEIETELTLKALRRQAPILFVPVGYHPRTKEQGKKINFMDFLKISAMYVRLQVSPA